MHNTVNHDSIADMVDTFYSAIRHDGMLGPIFRNTIGEEWTPHLTKMKAFWSTVLLGSCTYKGNPMMAHLQLPLLTEIHFNRWLQLWRETAGMLCSRDLADVFTGKAETIGARLLSAISQHHNHFAAQAE